MCDLDFALKTALEAAEAGAAILLEGYMDGGDLGVRYKGDIDLVTKYDTASEQKVVEIIGAAFPDHQIIGEEGGPTGQFSSPYKWYIDPLDGTTNFAHKHPFFAVSIGLVGPDETGHIRPLVGVVKAPVLGETFWAQYGAGAFRRHELAGRPPLESRLSVSNTHELKQSMLLTGFPYSIENCHEVVMSALSKLLLKARAVRRDGAASLDLAMVASGVADGYWERFLRGWDVAAGILLVTEAGGQISEFKGLDYQIGGSGDILASNGLIHYQLLEEL